ncbi:hypothetical protein EGT74_24560 [Chitinophaga lutea]|uniref:Tail spike domain-containing protein n=1 Tax=Chitinophaga lutea TaxID=2488634 RepID=A0A3N4PGB2_9BACT|nr:phage tail protein [Chitinophaga lutea]RPE05559.1 hypothetical protein EGT74_24560 [Chitinophaga lutea]
MIAIDILRGSDLVVTIKPDSSSNQSKAVMGDNVINLQFDLNQKIDFKLGDWCTVYGENYFLNKMPVVNKVSTYLYEYTLVMQSEYYDLGKAMFMFYDAANELKEGEFSLMGNADEFLNLIIKNANRVGAGWTKGAAISTPYVNMTFKSETCLAALVRVAQQFGTEYFVNGKVISIDKRQKDRGITLRHGRDKGLTKIDTKTQGDSSVVTRLYAFGSDKNLPPNYRNYADRLRMTDGQLYLEKNVEKYGVIEASKVFEDVYPHRTGKLTAVDAGNPFSFKDAAIDFDVNNQLMPGVAAKITFNTGQLAGYTFDIQRFDNSLKQFTILKNKDEKALDVPSSLIRPAIGDEYVLVDIIMPESYVTAAEAQLKVKAQNLVNSISEPLIEFSVTSDPIYFRKKSLKIDIGDLVWITDPDLEINKRIRVIGIVRSFQDEYEYQLTLSDGLTTSPTQDWYGGISGNSREIADINSRLNNRSSENNFVGNVIMADIPVASDTSGMFQVFVDGSGKLYKKM